MFCLYLSKEGPRASFVYFCIDRGPSVSFDLKIGPWMCKLRMKDPWDVIWLFVILGPNKGPRDVI